MAEPHWSGGKGQGYFGQGLCTANFCRGLWFRSQLEPRQNLNGENRDAFLLAIGPYSIASHAALAECETYSKDDLKTWQ